MRTTWQRASAHFPVLYKGNAGLVAHECIIDVRPLKDSVSVEYCETPYGFRFSRADNVLAGRRDFDDRADRK